MYNGQYACTKEVAGTGARCRNQQGNCPSHSSDPGKWASAAVPTLVIFKVELLRDWRSYFGKIEVEFRTWSDRMQRAAKHVEQAEALGRSTKAFVGQIERAGEPAPENWHSGTPIFGDEGGLDRVDVTKVIPQLRAAGFALTGISILARPTGKVKKSDMLVLEFHQGTNEVEFPNFPWDVFGELVSIAMTYVHVWANPPKDGGCVHTVNCLIDDRQQHRKPKYALNFDLGNEGYWTATPVAVLTLVAPPVATTQTAV